MRSPHPSSDEPGVLEHLGVLSDGGESALCPADADGVVLSDVPSGGHVELVGGYDAGGSETCPAVDPLDGVSGGVSQKAEDAEGLLGGGHDDLLVVHDILDLDVESHLGPLVDDEAGGGEGVEEDPGEDGRVCGRLGLVGHEEHEGLGRPLLEGHLRGTGSRSLDVSGEGVGEDVLSGGVEVHGFGDLGGLLEALPCGGVDLFVALALVVGHVEVDVVADAGDVEVLDNALLLFVGQDLFRFGHHGGMGGHVTAYRSDVCFDD